MLLEPTVDQSMLFPPTSGSGGCFGDGDRKFCPGKHSPVGEPRSDLGARSYLKWCVNLVPLVLRSRTPLASFLSKTISLSKDFRNQEWSCLDFFPCADTLFSCVWPDGPGQLCLCEACSSHFSCHPCHCDDFELLAFWW